MIQVRVISTYPRYYLPYGGHRLYTYYTPSEIYRLRPTPYLRELERLETVQYKYYWPAYDYLGAYVDSLITVSKNNKLKKSSIILRLADLVV